MTAFDVSERRIREARAEGCARALRSNGLGLPGPRPT